ncbi:sugar phosphate permease [Paraburkholderia unamae]|uniref:MFS transporter n=1 Tax=Paraburkholderia unamae TaxID=219649 RepID=UPI000DC43CBC|nr:MFS transporter [Paraburkholderia unamae]RAR49212.1 sugar phosphate permease [Paraburkholderia unamae]
MESIENANRALSAAGATASRAKFVVGALFFINMVGYLDRQILTLFVQPIKHSLGLSDGQMGLMQGAAFVLAFTVAGPFIGRLVDQRNRRNVLAACIAIWSLSAAASGFAHNATQLFFARMGVGMGEAALLPAALSLIADYFDATRRGKALGFFLTGVYAGAGLSLAIVGFALPGMDGLAARLAAAGLPIETWRLVMFAMLLPGALCCALLVFVQEPPRAFAASHAAPLDWSGLRDWVHGIALYVPHHVSFALITFCSFATTGWVPTVLIREHGFAAREAGMTYGCLLAVIGCAAAYLGGVIGDYRSRKAGGHGRVAVAAWCLPFAAAGFATVALAPNAGIVLAGTALLSAALGVAMVIGLLSIADLAPARSRGQISSIYLIFTGLIGSAGGPACIGYANDLWGAPGRPLSVLLGLVCLAVLGAAALLLWICLGKIRARTVR